MSLNYGCASNDVKTLNSTTAPPYRNLQHAHAHNRTSQVSFSLLRSTPLELHNSLIHLIQIVARLRLTSGSQLEERSISSTGKAVLVKTLLGPSREAQTVSSTSDDVST